MVLTQEEKEEQIKYWKSRIEILKVCSEDINVLLSELSELVLAIESIPTIEGKVEVPNELGELAADRLVNEVSRLKSIKRNLGTL